MTVLFACTETSGFKRTGVENTVAPIAGRSRCNLGGGGGTYRFDLPSALPAGWFSCQNKRTNTGSGAEVEFFAADDTPVFRIYKTATSTCRIDYWSGSAYVIGATFTVGYTGGNILCQIEFSTGTDGSVSYYEDSELVYTLSIGSATSSISYGIITPLGNTASASSTNAAVSEVIVTDTERNLLYCQVETEAPTADGGDIDGTGSYADVDEAANDGGSACILMATVGDQQSFTAAARTSMYPDGVILAVTVAVDMRRGGTSPPRARFYLKIGGVRYYSPIFDVDTAFRGYQYAWDENPATSAPWTPTDANDAALEWGVETVAAA